MHIKKKSKNYFLVNSHTIFLKKIQISNIFSEFNVSGWPYANQKNPLKVNLRHACMVHVWENSLKLNLYRYMNDKN